MSRSSSHFALSGSSPPHMACTLTSGSLQRSSRARKLLEARHHPDTEPQQDSRSSPVARRHRSRPRTVQARTRPAARATPRSDTSSPDHTACTPLRRGCSGMSRQGTNRTTLRL
eukprot:791186-Rhodomonas_salina.3